MSSATIDPCQALAAPAGQVGSQPGTWRGSVLLAISGAVAQHGCQQLLMSSYSQPVPVLPTGGRFIAVDHPAIIGWRGAGEAVRNPRCRRIGASHTRGIVIDPRHCE